MLCLSVTAAIVPITIFELVFDDKFSDDVHDDGEEPVPVRQVVPLLDIDPHQFVVVKGRSPGATCLVSMQLI